MNDHSDTKKEVNQPEFSEVRRRLLKLAAYVPPAIMGAALFDVSAAAASGDDKEGDKEGDKKNGKEGGKKESCAPHVCRPHHHGDKNKNEDKNKS